MKVRPFLVWGSVIVAALVLPILGSFTMSTIEASQWRQLESEARAANVPLDMKQALAGSWEGPDSENAAEGVKDALRSILNPRLPEQVEFQPNVRNSPLISFVGTEADQGLGGNIRAMRDAIKPFESALEGFQTALEKPHWDFKRDWTIYTDTVLPEMRHLEDLNRALAGKAMISWKEKPADSIRALQAMTRLSNHLLSEPILRCIQGGLNCRLMVYQTASSLAGSAPVSEPLRKQLLDVVRTPIPPVNWQRVWHVDNAYTFASLDLPVSKEVGRNLTTMAPTRSTRSKRSLHRAKMAMAKLMIEVAPHVNAANVDPKTMRAIAGRYYMPIQTVLYDYKEIASIVISSPGVDPFSKTVWSADICEAQRRLTYLSILMAETKPAALPPEATRAEWLDPFSGRPFIRAMRKLYSVGPNGIDDGGLVHTLNGLPTDVVAFGVRR